MLWFKYNGTSVVDYIIMSEDLIQQTLNCKVSNVIPCLSDCHCKVSFMLLALSSSSIVYGSNISLSIKSNSDPVLALKSPHRTMWPFSE
jgi:hypothetical protein